VVAGTLTVVGTLVPLIGVGSIVVTGLSLVVPVGLPVILSGIVVVPTGLVVVGIVLVTTRPVVVVTLKVVVVSSFLVVVGASVVVVAALVVVGASVVVVVTTPVTGGLEVVGFTEVVPCLGIDETVGRLVVGVRFLVVGVGFLVFGGKVGRVVRGAAIVVAGVILQSVPSATRWSKTLISISFAQPPLFFVSFKTMNEPLYWSGLSPTSLTPLAPSPLTKE
jgi:hypothetical protein